MILSYFYDAIVKSYMTIPSTPLLEGDEEHVVPKGHSTIARRFNAVTRIPYCKSPEGTDDRFWKKQKATG
jgi:hypothetical protein